MQEKLIEILKSQLLQGERASSIFKRSLDKSRKLLSDKSGQTLTDDERETLESLTSRYARSLDYLTQKLFRTIDQIELSDEGSILDRFNRFKKRGILREEVDYRFLKDLRNRISHEYIIEESDSVIKDVLDNGYLIAEMLEKLEAYCRKNGFI